MASTYSGLKIQLMATGENSGTWGNVTNVNLGTAIEEAIVGSADVIFSNADLTLTLTDSNSSQIARNLRLNLTGSIAADRNLTVPAIEKIYIVNNTLTHAVTVRNATGTGIVVPAGKTMWVYNDGTNIVDAVNHLTSLTLDTPLAVAQGGTGSNTGVNLASAAVSGILPNANTTAASANGASTIVARDASGNFSANTITANLTGLASSASNLTGGNVTGNLIVANATSPNSYYLQFGDNSGWVYRFMTSVSGTPTVRFSFVDNGNFTAVGNVTAFSDERLKKDWASIGPDFIEKLAQVKSGTYTRIDTGERQAGASAQDMQKLLPEVVQNGENLSLAYGNAALVAVIELAKQVTALKKELAELKGGV